MNKMRMPGRASTILYPRPIETLQIQMINWLAEISFANPVWFWSLLIIPFYWTYYWLTQKRRYPHLVFSNLNPIKRFSGGWRSYLVHNQLFLRTMVVVLLIICLARPQTKMSSEKVSTEGIDIVMALDISSSMLAQDFLVVVRAVLAAAVGMVNTALGRLPQRNCHVQGSDGQVTLHSVRHGPTDHAS